MFSSFQDEGGHHDPEARSRVGEAGAVLADAGADGASAGAGQGVPRQEAPPRAGKWHGHNYFWN